MNIADVGSSLERYLSLLSSRQKLVASNIANADTPGYHTRDIAMQASSFQSAFEASLGNGKPEVVELTGLTSRNDGNNVNLDREARMLAENALRFSVASNLARMEMRSIRTAIDEGKSS